MNSNWNARSAERFGASVSILFIAACASGSAGGPGAQHAETEEHHHGSATLHDGGEPRSEVPPSQASERSSPNSGAETDLAAAERASFDRARPVFERHCANCHTSSGRAAKASSLSHFSMDGYPLGGHHAHEIAKAIREVLGETGKAPTMPRDQPGAVKGDELKLVLAWADAFERSHAAGGHEHAGMDGDGHQHAH